MTQQGHDSLVRFLWSVSHQNSNHQCGLTDKYAVNKTSFKRLFRPFVVKVIRDFCWIFFTTRNRHAALTFKQVMRVKMAVRLWKAWGGVGAVCVPGKKLHLMTTSNESKMWKWLHFKVQQVAINLVVDIGIIFLLAQVKAGDVHRRLKKETYRWLVKLNIKMTSKTSFIHSFSKPASSWAGMEEAGMGQSQHWRSHQSW